MNKDYKELLTKACNLLAVATDSFPSDDEIVIAIDELMEEIKEVESKDDGKDNWISVEDRLPEEDGTMSGYLVAIGEWVGILAFYNGEFRVDLFGKKPEFPVHHWMPLPEPPEED